MMKLLPKEQIQNLNYLKKSIMKTQEISIKTLAFKAGFLTFICLVAYFILMKYLNLIPIIEFRAFNFFILLGGIFFSFRYYKSKTKKRMEYLQGLLLGFSISAISMICFALFAALYFSFVDPLLLKQLKDNSPMLGNYITPFSVALTIILEGMVSGLIFSFALRQYLQNDNTHK